MNDFWDATRNTVFSVENGTLIDNTPIKWSTTKKVFFHANQVSYLVRFVTGTLGRIVSLTDIANMLGVSSFRSDGALETVLWGIPKDLFFDSGVGEIELAYEKASLLLDKYKELSDKEGFRLIFAIIPMKEQVSENYLSDFKEQFNVSDDVDINLPYDRITKMMRERGIEVVDARVKMAAEEEQLNREGKSLYYRNDTHFNALGQYMFGEIIIDYLGG